MRKTTIILRLASPENKLIVPTVKSQAAEDTKEAVIKKCSITQILQEEKYT